MKIYAILVTHQSGDQPSGSNVKVLTKATDLSQFSFFERNAVGEFIVFTAKILTERTTVEIGRQSVKESNYMVHIRRRKSNVAAVCVTDQEYSHRVAHTLLDKVLDEFAGQVPAETYSDVSSLKDGGLSSFQVTLDQYLVRYQNPSEADGLSKVQAELDETKIVLHDTITAVLERGENLSEMVAKSEELSMNSKAFYKTARQTNRCCGYL